MAQRGKKRSVRGSDVAEDMVTVGDIAVPKRLITVDCALGSNATFITEMFYSVLSTPESTLIFCARQGWIDVTAPKCTKAACAQRNTSSYFIRKRVGAWAWRFRCCRVTASVFRSSMFFNSSYGPGKILQLM